MDDGEWADVNSTNGCGLSRADNGADLDFRNKIPVSSTGGDHVVNSVIYNAPDTYYGVPMLFT